MAVLGVVVTVLLWSSLATSVNLLHGAPTLFVTRPLRDTVQVLRGSNDHLSGQILAGCGQNSKVVPVDRIVSGRLVSFLDMVNRLAIALSVDPCLLLSSDPAEAPGDYVDRRLGDSVACASGRSASRAGATS